MRAETNSGPCMHCETKREREQTASRILAALIDRFKPFTPEEFKTRVGLAVTLTDTLRDELERTK